MLPNIWQIDEEAFDRQILTKFNKTRQDLNQDINLLRKWTKTQPHFPEEPSEALLRNIILYNKFSIEKAKQKLDMYYTIRSLIPEFYRSEPLLPELVLQNRVVYCVPLPKITPDFKRIIYSQVNPDFGPEFFRYEQFLENFCNLVELLVQEDKCYNFCYIFDCIGVQIGHLTKFNPMVLKKASIILEKVYSNRIAALYMVNFPKYMETVVNNVIKPMLNPKIRDRMSIHTGTDILLEKYGKSVMPRDIGGDERSLAELTDYILNEYEAKRDRFELLRTLRVDESLRPQSLVNDEILGYYGSFKKLSVD